MASHISPSEPLTATFLEDATFRATRSSTTAVAGPASATAGTAHSPILRRSGPTSEALYAAKSSSSSSEDNSTTSSHVQFSTRSRCGWLEAPCRNSCWTMSGMTARLSLVKAFRMPSQSALAKWLSLVAQIE